MATPEHSGRPILLVDDDLVLLDATKQFLEREIPGARVTAFGNGADALAASMDTKPRIAVLDVEMSPMSGLDVGTALRARWPDLPIMFVTGTASQLVTPQIEQLDAVAHLRKPVRTTDLLDAVLRHLEES